MKIHLRKTAIILSPLLFISVAMADIYQCKDNGTTSFQSKPCTAHQVFERKIEDGSKKPNIVPVTIIHPSTNTQMATTPTSTESPFYLRWFEKIKAFIFGFFKT